MVRMRRIWVDRDFHRELKKQAIEEDTTIVELTGKMGRRMKRKKGEPIEEDFFW